MKKIISIFVLLCMLTGCFKEYKDYTPKNPMVEVESVEEASEQAGFTLNAPSEVDQYELTKISVAKDERIEYIYTWKTNEIVIRKQPTEKLGEISGVDSQYTLNQGQAVTINSTRIDYELSSDNNGQYHLIRWYTNGYSYSIYAKDGITEEQKEMLIKNVA